jgi:ubiquinone/menaquinone biosynthesis C-methylase UbiE
MRENKITQFDDYIDRVYSVGLGPYMDALKPYCLEGMKNILDVGCGPGQWSLAAAQLRNDATITGLDTSAYLLDFAKAFARKRKIANCMFIHEGYENLPHRFKAEFFDLIMCNSVVHYVDEKKALQIFSRLLPVNGILLMFWNHGPSYYLWRLLKNMVRLELRNSLYPIHVMLIAALKRPPYGNAITYDHFVTFKNLKNIARKEGLRLERIRTAPALDYSVGLGEATSVFSCKGVKI